MYIGIDLGTSGVKALLINEQQSVIAVTEASLSVSHPHTGWSEQNPADWVSAITLALDELSSTHASAMSRVQSIALSGQMHGATVLDKHNKVLRPCMLWNDTRSHKEAAQLDAMPMFRELTGNIVFPGFTAPKVLWLKHHEPSLFDQVAKVLLPKDYVRFWLTGNHVSEMSDASGTAWLDVANRVWSAPLLAACGLSMQHMPSLVEGCDATGQLRHDLQQRWGISRTATVGGGAGDNAATACGMGVIDEGQSFVSLGTSGVLFAANKTYQPKADSAVHTFCHALPQRWHQMGVILSATDALNWYAKICGSTAEALTEKLGPDLQSSDLQGPSGISFLPYLSGERTPHNDASIRGAFVGLQHTDEQSHLTHAVLEGVCYALADNLSALRQTGTSIEQVMAVGGGSRSAYWLALLATVLNVPVTVPEEGDYGAAYGAARLAMLATGEYTVDEVCSAPRIKRCIMPNPSLVPKYQDAYQYYRELYPRLKGE